MKLKVTFNNQLISYEMEMIDKRPDIPVLFKCPEDVRLYDYFGQRVEVEYQRGDIFIHETTLCWWWCLEKIDGINYTSVSFDERGYRNES